MHVTLEGTLRFPSKFFFKRERNPRSCPKFRENFMTFLNVPVASKLKGERWEEVALSLPWSSVLNHWCTWMSSNVFGNVPAASPPNSGWQGISSASFSWPRKGGAVEKEKPSLSPKGAPREMATSLVKSSKRQSVHENFIHDGRRGHQVLQL